MMCTEHSPHVKCKISQYSLAFQYRFLFPILSFPPSLSIVVLCNRIHLHNICMFIVSFLCCHIIDFFKLIVTTFVYVCVNQERKKLKKK